MASLAQIAADSDSENDSDFVPGAEDGSGSESDSQASGRSTKRTKLEGEARDGDVKDAEKEARSSAWAAFQATLASSNTKPVSRLPEVKMIKIQKRYRFAGEEVLKTEEVPENSDEARAWLASKRELSSPIPVSLSDKVEPSPTPEQSAPRASSPNNHASGSSTATSPERRISSTVPLTTTPPNPITQSFLSHSASDRVLPRVDSSSSVTNQFSDLKTENGSAAAPKPAPKPRPKAGGGFGALIKAKPKKLSTLEKSRMDWNSHVASAGEEMKDELEANRRGGGYIEKVEFLGRVSERVEETLDNAKGSKRKR